MKAIGIIPARMSATRFPGKPMAMIHGVPMVGHCYFRTRMCKKIEETYVATCDEDIADYVSSVGGKVVMTGSHHNRASDRTAEAMLKVEAESGPVEVVVMVQGDEPLIGPDAIDGMLKHFEDPSVDIANIMSRLCNIEEFKDRNNVKVVVNHSNDALYFSREPIPSPWKGTQNLPMFIQVGVIAFRREALVKFNQMPETSLEQAESVDMNRVLETGGRIRMIVAESRTIGVDTPSDLESVERLMRLDKLLRTYTV
jgi:3-deoxy-manno-octulosonate cytidylyltransferase (CMP-KDO synthetase)